MACCHVDLSSVPTHAENYPPTLRGVHTRTYHKCILELGVYVSQLPSDLPTTLRSTPAYSPQMCFSTSSFYWKATVPPPPLPTRGVSDGKGRAGFEE